MGMATEPQVSPIYSQTPGQDLGWESPHFQTRGCSAFTSYEIKKGCPQSFPGGSGKDSACQHRRLQFDPWVRKIPWRKKWQSTPVFLSEKSHGQRSLEDYSPWGRKRVGSVSLLKKMIVNKICFLVIYLRGIHKPNQPLQFVWIEYFTLRFIFKSH